VCYTQNVTNCNTMHTTNTHSLELTFTSHPTNTHFNFKDVDGNLRRPYMWEEIAYYCNKIPQFMTNIKDNPYAKDINQFNTWVGYDMDRHQDEREGIFLYSYLKHIQGIAKGYGGVESQDLVNKTQQACTKIEKEFQSNGNKGEINIAEYQSEMNNINDLLLKFSESESYLKGNKELLHLFPINGFNGEYRISSSDLKTSKGIEKIKTRLQEVKYIKSSFGKAPVNNLIIADCTSADEIVQVKKILQEAELDKDLTVVPLIEEELSDEILEDVLSKIDTKVMLAGSDSIQRETYVGAMLMKIKIQQHIDQRNTERAKDEKTPIGLFDGTGSSINRSGCILPSRMGAVLKDMPYERTIQGQQYENFMIDAKYQKHIVGSLSQSKRCTIDEINTAEDILHKIYQDISAYQKERQKDDNNEFTSLFDKEKIVSVLAKNAHCGSRSKIPTLETFKIKDLRAIDQSFVNNTMCFHPEMLYWNKLTSNTKKDILSNIENPLVQDFINHYTAIHQMCDLEVAKKWITDKNTYKEFNNGCYSCKAFLHKVYRENIGNNDIMKKLILQDYGDVTTSKDVEFNYSYCNGITDYRPVLHMEALSPKDARQAFNGRGKFEHNFERCQDDNSKRKYDVHTYAGKG
jgi:hypothetical protein